MAVRPSFGSVRTSRPADGLCTRNSVVPWVLFCTFVSDRARTRRWSATCAWVDQIFWPRRVQPPATLVAVVRIAPSRSVPPEGSVTEMENRARPSAIAGM